MNKIEQKFFEQDTLKVAKNLLGCILCRRIGRKLYKGIIVETEAYTQEDPSCHAYRGITPRSKILFEKAGTVYVYFTYGLHHCVNFVTEKEGYGSAVLIRALEPVLNIDNSNGPAKLCKAMQITKEINGIDSTSKNSPLWIEYGNKIEDENIVTTTRIGISQAKDYPWRFYIKDNKWVSRN